MAAKTSDEARYMIIGFLKSEIYSCIFTLRGKKIRIISCRKSHRNERRFYYEKIG